MMSAPTGSRPKVIGSSMVMVAIGPTPGSTPIRVPIRQPRKQYQTFLRERATSMPSARLAIRSVTACPQRLMMAFKPANSAATPLLRPT